MPLSWSLSCRNNCSGSNFKVTPSSNDYLARMTINLLWAPPLKTCDFLKDPSILNEKFVLVLIIVPGRRCQKDGKVPKSGNWNGQKASWTQVKVFKRITSINSSTVKWVLYKHLY